MTTHARRCRGYSLIELLVVLGIVTILVTVGVVMIGDRRSNSVRSVLDEVEGTIYSAQKASVTTAQDIYLSTSGTWDDGSLIMDGRPLRIPDPIPSPFPSAAYLVAGLDGSRIGASTECFRSRSPRDRDHISAEVDVSNADYVAALGGATALDAVDPVSADADLVEALGNPIFNGGDNVIVINGLTKRFMTGFCVVVVGIRSGEPIARGPIGILVVPRNGSSVFKYYKADQSSDWRRL